MKRRRVTHRRGAISQPGPARTESAGLAAARARVEALLDRLSRVDLQVVVVAPPDAVRRAARERARTACVLAGRVDLMDEATDAARELSLRAFARGGFSGTWAATDMAASVTRPSDRVAAASAFEEAALAAVADDLIDPDARRILQATAGRLVGLTGIPSPGALSSLAAPRSGYERGPLQLVAVTTVVIGGILLWIGVGVGFGVLGIVVGLALIATLARRQPRPSS